MPQSTNQFATKLPSVIHFLIMTPHTDTQHNMCFEEEANNMAFLPALRYIYFIQIRPCYTFFSTLAWEHSLYGHEDVCDHGCCHGLDSLRLHVHGSDHVCVYACAYEHARTPPHAVADVDACSHADACCHSGLYGCDDGDDTPQ